MFQVLKKIKMKFQNNKKFRNLRNKIYNYHRITIKERSHYLKWVKLIFWLDMMKISMMYLVISQYLLIFQKVKREDRKKIKKTKMITKMRENHKRKRLKVEKGNNNQKNKKSNKKNQMYLIENLRKINLLLQIIKIFMI